MELSLTRHDNKPPDSFIQSVCNKFSFLVDFFQPRKKYQEILKLFPRDSDTDSDTDTDSKSSKNVKRKSGKILSSNKRNDRKFEPYRENPIIDTENPIIDTENPIIDIEIPEDFTIINDSTEKIILSRDNHSIRENEEIYSQILELEKRLIQSGIDIPRHLNFRNMGVLIKKKDGDPNIIELHFLDNSNEYKKLSELLTTEDLLLIESYKIDIVKTLLLQAKKMGIELKYPFLLFSNVPFNYEGTTALYHHDNIVITVTNESFSTNLFRIFNFPEVNYSFFKYKNNCVSTTISFNYKGKKVVIRFQACPDTTIAIDNIYTIHSKPYYCDISNIDIFPKVNREIGNELLAPINTLRSLNRIGIKFLTLEEYEKLSKIPNLINSSVELNEESLQPSEKNQSIGVEQFLRARNIGKVVFGGRKKSIKKRKTKRRKTKRKVIRKY